LKLWLSAKEKSQLSLNNKDLPKPGPIVLADTADAVASKKVIRHTINSLFLILGYIIYFAKIIISFE
jgi:hypothetical protein